MATFLAIVFGVFLVMVTGTIAAEPFLVSDPYPARELQPTKFVVTVGGKSVEVAPEKNPDGSSFLKYDLSGLPDGVHTVKIKAVDSTTKQESSEVSITLQKTGSKVTRAKEDSEKLAPSRTYPGYIRP